jgi:hypothetical protein
MMLVSAAASAALVASWLAQAEPAPPEPSPIAAPAPAAAPAGSAAPSAAPAGPATPPEPAELTPRLPRYAVAVHGRFAYRPNDSGSGVPAEGFSLGGTLEGRYADIGRVLGLGVGLDLFFDRFASDQKNMTNGVQVALYAHELTQTSFVALQTAALEHLPVRPWIAAGGGVAVGSSTRPVARGAAGVELGLSRATAIALRADLTHALANPGTYGDILDVGVGFLERF